MVNARLCVINRASAQWKAKPLLSAQLPFRCKPSLNRLQRWNSKYLSGIYGARRRIAKLRFQNGKRTERIQRWLN
jgi:hypothetical protein